MTKIESGRSMVEMLGVLAIIGVLSIGGIAGYTIAMNRYRANEILDLAAKVAVLGMTKQAGTNANMEEVTTQTNVHGVTAMTANSTGYVTLTSAASSGVNSAISSIAGTKAVSATELNFAE